MTTRTGSKSHTVARRVAPFAPLALSVLAASSGGPSHTPAAATAGSEPIALPDATPAQCDNVTDMLDCHQRYPTGCSASANPRYDAALNLLKNRLVPPPASESSVRFLAQSDFQEIDSETTSDITSHDGEIEALAALGEGSTVGVIAYLTYVKASDAESSNCQIGKSAGVENVDFHIGLGFDPAMAARLVSGDPKLSAAEQKDVARNSVIVEMTPHYRYTFQRESWTLEGLKAVVGRQVKVVGQLLADTEHNKPAQNCALASTSAQQSSCWRASVWELHPVTRFLVCTDPSNDCSSTSSKWLELDAAVRAIASP